MAIELLMTTNNIIKEFGTAIRHRRSDLGISQEELAERADLHRTYVSDVERGARNISLQSIAKLAGALTISIASLFPEAVTIGQAGPCKSGGPERSLVEVLLVEDDPADVELTLCAFDNARFTNRTHVVRDGAQALDYIFCRGEFACRPMKANPQLILLDLNLPKVNGLEVLRQIKADKRTRLIPVAILTASQDIREIAECRRLGAEQYIAKPVNLQRLSLITAQFKLEWALLKARHPVRETTGQVNWAA